VSDEEKIEYLTKTLQLVVACFKSRAESSTCIEDHHPSCLQLIEGRLKEIEDVDNEVKLKEADAMLSTAKLILAEADTMRKQGLKTRATAYQLKADAVGLDWCATDDRREYEEVS